MKRLGQLWERLHSSFWFLPTFLVLASGILGIALVELDSRVQADVVGRFPRIFAISAEGAQGILQAIATSMITVAGVIFSIPILILNEASNQYSPRILRNFVRDHSNQGVLGVLEAVRKGLRIRMGRYPAEIAEGAEVYWEGGKGTYIGAVFNNCLGLLKR